jgi:excisionase family DNA binding protein
MQRSSRSSDAVTEPLVVPVRQASKSSGIPRDAIYEAVKDGRIRVLRRGRRILVPVAELERFVARELEESP